MRSTKQWSREDTLFEEGEELVNGRSLSAALNAALIATAQSVEHYEITESLVNPEAGGVPK